MSTPKFAMQDTKRADGCYIQFERVTCTDSCASPHDYLFQDDEFRDEDQKRLDAFNRGDWCFIGVRAVAHCLIVRNGTGTNLSIESPGLWGVESDSSEEFLAEIYSEEIAALKEILAAFDSPTFEK